MPHRGEVREPDNNKQRGSGRRQRGHVTTVIAPSRLTLADIARLLVILAGAFMVVLDFFIVLVALPSIADDLAATPGQLQLIVAGYGIANAAGLIAGGKFGRSVRAPPHVLARHGAVRLTSVACGLSTSGLMLVVARFAQGAAGALLHPQVLALLGSELPRRQAAARIRGLRDGDGAGGCGGPVAGRRADRAQLRSNGLAQLLLHQRAGRTGRHRAGPAAARPRDAACQCQATRFDGAWP